MPTNRNRPKKQSVATSTEVSDGGDSEDETPLLELAKKKRTVQTTIRSSSRIAKKKGTQVPSIPSQPSIPSPPQTRVSTLKLKAKPSKAESKPKTKAKGQAKSDKAPMVSTNKKTSDNDQESSEGASTTGTTQPTTEKVPTESAEKAASILFNMTTPASLDDDYMPTEQEKHNMKLELERMRDDEIEYDDQTVDMVCKIVHQRKELVEFLQEKLLELLKDGFIPFTCNKAYQARSMKQIFPKLFADLCYTYVSGETSDIKSFKKDHTLGFLHDLNLPTYLAAKHFFVLHVSGTVVKKTGNILRTNVFGTVSVESLWAKVETVKLASFLNGFKTKFRKEGSFNVDQRGPKNGVFYPHLRFMHHLHPTDFTEEEAASGKYIESKHASETSKRKAKTLAGNRRKKKRSKGSNSFDDEDEDNSSISSGGSSGSSSGGSSGSEESND